MPQIKESYLIVRSFWEWDHYSIYIFHMQAQTKLSGKDLQLIKLTYRTVIQNYYENTTDDNAAEIVNLNQLVMQTISTQSQSEAIGIISMLQILKVKGKGHPELVESAQNTIIHLKNPMKIYLKDSTLQECLDKIAIFPLCCTLIAREYESEMKPRGNEYDWKNILTKIGKNADKSMLTSLQSLVILLPNFQNFAKDVNKSGLIKFICSVYLLQTLEDKHNLYKALKVIKLVAGNDRTVLLNRQKNISTVMYTHQQYIPIIREISELCFDQQYCLKAISNTKDIDPTYVWSYNNRFCQLASQNTIESLESILKNSKNTISPQVEWKIYSAINNLIRSNGALKIGESWKIPFHAQKNLNAYLKLMISEVDAHPNHYERVNIKAIQYAYDKSNTSDPVSEKLIAELKQLDPASKKKAVGQLKASSLQMYEMDKNAEMLMEKAMKIPKNNEDLKFTQQVLDQKPHNSDQFQQDTLSTIKQKALDSLKQAVAQDRPINLPQLFNDLHLGPITPEELNRLFKISQLYLTMNPDMGSQFDKKKLLDIIQWLEDNHGNSVIDWVAVGQTLSIVVGPDEWKLHIKDIPSQTFWLLNAYDCEVTDSLLKQLKSIDLNHPKVPLILGFLGKAGDPVLKKLLLEKTGIPGQAVSNVTNYKNPRTSVKPYMSMRSADYPIEAEQMNKYLNNVLNLSHFIYNWQKGDIQQQIKDKIIKPVLPSIYHQFLGTDPEFRFLQNSLPFTLDLSQLKDMNVTKLLEKHGRLSAYLHKNKYDGRIDFSNIASLSQLLDEPFKVEEILKFLADSDGMIEAEQLNNLLNRLIKNAEKQKKYWKMFPHYMSILNNILSIATKSSDPVVIDKLSELIEKMLIGTIDNQDISPEQLEELYQNIHNALKKLRQRNIKLDTHNLQTEALKIQNEAWRDRILQELKKMQNMKVEAEKPPKKISLETQTISMQPEPVANKYTNINPALSQPKPIHDRANPSVLASKANFQNVSVLQIKIQSEPDKKGEKFEEGEFDTNDLFQKQKASIQTQTEKDILDALEMLRKIVNKEQPKELFPKLVQIFLTTDFNANKRFILGHLLVQYYEIIEKDEKAIALLQMRNKTNLGRTICYNFLKKNEQVFLLAKRWKLYGLDFMDLAVERFSKVGDAKNKRHSIENGCEVAEYNLQKNSELSYFEGKKYHHLVVDIFSKVNEVQEAIYYLLLVGASARLMDVKTHYIKNKLHIRLLDMVNYGWMLNKYIVAHLSYALSSLVYTQNHISIEVVSRKAEMLKLLEAYKEFNQTKTVVQSGCSLISNLCYSNKQCKQILDSYGVTSILLLFMKANLENPQVSTYKQIMRGMGNLSLHKPSIEKLVDNNVNLLIIEMIEKFNILIYRDEERLKVLKLTIDFISNMSTQKYRQDIIHQEGITDFVITLIETTEISEDHVIMGCVDTIDGLCQNQVIENYCVMDKKLPYLLIDLLKVKEDERLITKCIRLLTNMTINETCIPYILEANLLSVLANVVIPVYHNPKIQAYINKLIHRIFSKKPPIKQIIKCGYLDCLLKTIDHCSTVQDTLIDIMLHYAQYFPSYLINRAFFSNVKFLTIKQNSKHSIEKAFKVLKIMFSSEQKEDIDFEIEGAVEMYEKLIQGLEAYKQDLIYLLALHCTKSRKFKASLIHLHQNKKTGLINLVHGMSLHEQTRELGSAAFFAALNNRQKLQRISQVPQEEQFAFQLLKKGCKCKLYRLDGSWKSAVIDISEQYVIRAYKYPDGEFKKKYMMSVRQVRDWQFDLHANDDIWKHSLFSRQKGLFDGQAKPQLCVILMGARIWGQFSFINIQFQSSNEKRNFVNAICALLLSFRG